MYLFIDVISPQGTLILFKDYKIISESKVNLKGKEYDNLLEKMEELLKDNGIGFENLSGITVINGPGSFTGTRVIALTINTLILVYGIPVEAMDYFTFLNLSGVKYPMAIKANKNEYLIKNSEGDNPLIKKLEEIEDGRYFGIGDNIDFENRDIYVEFTNGYDDLLKKYRFNGKPERIEPLYIKKPNIT